MSDADLLAALERQTQAIARLVEQVSSNALPVVMNKRRAAHELGCSVTTLARMVRRGDIHLTKDGKVPASEVLRYATVGAKPEVKTEKYSSRTVAEKVRAMRVP